MYFDLLSLIHLLIFSPAEMQNLLWLYMLSVYIVGHFFMCVCVCFIVVQLLYLCFCRWILDMQFLLLSFNLPMSFLIVWFVLQVKVAILKYIETLTLQMEAPDFVNSSETRLAVSRIITWTTEPKSSDVRKVLKPNLT